MTDDERAPRGWFLPALLVVLVLATAATCVVLLQDRDDDADPVALVSATAPEAEAAVGVAERAARTYFTLDFRDPRAGVRRLKDLATADFLAMLREQLPDLEQRLEKRRLELSATVPSGAAAVEFVDASRAQVLVPVDVASIADGRPAGTERYRIRVRLVASESDWLLTGLDQVSG